MKTQSAFSLLELIVSMGLLMILSTIAYPIYSGHLARSYRQNAELQLLKLAQNLEIYHGEMHSYVGYTHSSHSQHYEIQVAEATEEHYVLEAKPDSIQARRDKNCGSLNLDSTGKRGSSGKSNSTQCWNFH